MILALKTANPITEIYLLDQKGKIIAEKIWQSERRLAKELLGEIETIIASITRSDLRGGDIKSPLIRSDLTGLIVFTGPGSFTGLRIGITTMNTLTYGLNIPIIGTNGENWLQSGLKRLANNENDRIITPQYGAEANISKPKK